MRCASGSHALPLASPALASGHLGQHCASTTHVAARSHRMLALQLKSEEEKQAKAAEALQRDAQEVCYFV
jgi:transcriptional antiterminator Rof (Rho-off)